MSFTNINHYWEIIKKILVFLYSANVTKTIVFNFRYLPAKQAFRLPIHLFGNIDICGHGGGKIKFTSSCKLHFGAWKIGHDQSMFSGYSLYPEVTRLLIDGILHIGESGEIRNGCIITVKPHSDLYLGNGFWLGHGSKICCREEIKIGDNVQASWECQIFDTDFHFLANSTGTVRKCNKSVYIGANTWLGNRVTVGKGSYIADWSVVASNSLVTADLGKTPHCIYGGVPAKLIKKHYHRIWDKSLESKLNNWFDSHPESSEINIEKIK